MSNKVSIIEDLKKLTEEVIGSENLSPIEKAVPSSLDILDLYAGGGFALGTFNTFAGMSHSGKSTLAIQIAANIQKNNPDAIVVYFDTENAVTVKRLAQLGVNVDQLIFVSGDITIESIFRLIDKFMAYKEKNNTYDTPLILIWDSVAFTPSERALAGQEIQNTDGMIRAKVISEYLPRYIGKFKKYNMIMFAINQLREKMQLNPYQGGGVTLKGMGNYSMPGGSALHFACFHLLLMKPKEVLQPESYGFQGLVVECTFVKNKAERPLKPFYMVLDVDHGFSNFWTYYFYMKHFKLMTTGAWNSIPGYDKKFRTKEAYDLYKTDDAFKQAFDELSKQVLEKLREDLSRPEQIQITIGDDS